MINQASKLKIVLVDGVFFLIAFLIGIQIFGYDRDYGNYYYFFTADNGYISESEYELGFKLAVILFKSLSLPVWSYYLIFALVSIMPKLFLIKKVSFGSLVPYVLFFSPFIFVQDDTAIRLALSLSFLAWGIFYLTGKSYTKSAILMCASLLFHDQSLVAIFLSVTGYYFIRKNDALGILYILIGLVAVLIFSRLVLTYFENEIVGYFPKAYKYFYPDYFKRSPSLINPFILGNMLLSMWGMNSVITKDEVFYKLMWFLGVVGVLVYYALSGLGNIGFRISEGLIIFNCFWVGFAINSSSITSKYVGTCIVLGLLMLTMYTIFINYGDFPYYYKVITAT